MHIRFKVSALALAVTLSGGTTLVAVATSAGPAGAAGAGGRAILAPLPGGQAHAVHGFSQLGSYNWSGWAQGAPSGTYKSVTDTWIVPTVNTSLSGDQYSSDWVGIGGLNDSTLVQAGTEADNIGGTAFYQAWTEVLPAPENPLTLTVHPGDKITTTIKFTAKSASWKMTVKDVTTHKTGKRTVSQGVAGSTEASAEAIHERPCIADGCTSVSDLANLTQTTNVTFDPGKWGTTSLMTPAPGATVDQISMVNNADTAVIASPSNPDADNDGFTVADGSVQPPPPAS
jgi:hypothetical protein